MKKIIAFYDLLLCLIICAPFTICSVILLFFVNKSDVFLMMVFGFGIMLPIGGSLFIRHTEFNNDNVYFMYIPFTKSLEKAANNIDASWNQYAFISEIKDIEIVRITDEEKQTKVFYKHWFNKYLKINLEYGSTKYVYVGNYSNRQIEKIINIIKNKK